MAVHQLNSTTHRSSSTQQERKNQRSCPVPVLTYCRHLLPPTTAGFINKYSTEGGSRRSLDKGLGRRVVPLYQCTYPIYLSVNHDLMFLPTHHPTSSSGGMLVKLTDESGPMTRTAKARPQPQRPHHHPYKRTAHGGTLGPRDNRMTHQHHPKQRGTTHQPCATAHRWNACAGDQ